MKRYIRLIIAFLSLRIFLALIVSSVLPGFSALIDGLIIVATLVLFAGICNKLINVTAEGELPRFSDHIISTVTFSGILLISYPINFLVASLMPVLSYRTNTFVRYGGDVISVVVVETLCCILLLFGSVATIKCLGAKLSWKTILFSGIVFAFLSLSFQGFISDFVFGCYIATYLIRYGSITAGGVYIFLYKALWIVMEHVSFAMGQIAETNIISDLPVFAGLICLFGSFLLLGIYLYLRFFHFKKKTPMLSAFTLPAIAIMALVGYSILYYIKT